jgi:predicted DNA-binding transcriptional regulator AlpA
MDTIETPITAQRLAELCEIRARLARETEDRESAALFTALVDFLATATEDVHFLRLEQVLERVALKKSQVYEMESLGKFPRRVPLVGTTATRWVDREVAAFQRACIRARDEAEDSAPTPLERARA